MPDLKTISHEAIPRATQKAERYRLLNQSWATESICLDILEIDPANQPVLVMLLLAITDQFGPGVGRARRGGRARSSSGSPTRTSARTTPASSTSGSAHAQLASGAMHAEAMAHATLRSAMDSFEEAEQLRQPGNDDAILRWNTCQRTLDADAPARSGRRSSTSPASGNDRRIAELAGRFYSGSRGSGKNTYVCALAARKPRHSSASQGDPPMSRVTSASSRLIAGTIAALVLAACSAPDAGTRSMTPTDPSLSKAPEFNSARHEFKTKQFYARPGGSGKGTGITYHGGTVIAGPAVTKVVAIYWVDGNDLSLAADGHRRGWKRRLAHRVVPRHLGGSPYFNINTTYYNALGLARAEPGAVHELLGHGEQRRRPVLVADGRRT